MRCCRRARKGDISVPIALVVFFGLLALGIVIFMSSARQVVQTKADIENIAQGDTVLFAMLESGICAPVSGAPLKYVVGVGLAKISGSSPPPDPVSITFDGKEEQVKVVNCVKKFLDSMHLSNYNFSVNYKNGRYYTVLSAGYDSAKPEKTETIFISVPDSSSSVAKITLSKNLPERGEEACQEKDGASFCTPETYCLLSGRTCSKDSGGKDYLCGGATCCCREQD